MIQSVLSALTFQPKQVTPPFSWVGHLPFAATLVSETKPKILVELGTHTGNSYFTFCQAVQENSLTTECYAVDTWEGEQHTGFYDESIFEAVSEYNSGHYRDFSKLLRTTFDDAANRFEDQSIDLLHIDGLHTYEAVKNDYETWLPKVRDGGVILFHDICCRHEDFGVWKLWEEIQQTNKYTFSFLHSYGLGVLVKSDASIQNEFLAELINEQRTDAWQNIFTKAGRQIANTADIAEKEILTAQLFLSNEQEFHEEHSHRLRYKSGKNLRIKFGKLDQHIKLDQPLYLRFDPADQVALIALEEINLVFDRKDGKQIKYKLDLSAQLNPAVDLITYAKEPYSHISTGIDPQFIIEPITMSEGRLISVEASLSINTDPHEITTELKSLIDERDNSVASLQTTLAKCENSITSFQTELAKCENSITSFQTELNERTDKVIRMQKSFSWKCTAPLRALRRLIQKKRFDA